MVNRAHIAHTAIYTLLITLLVVSLTFNCLFVSREIIMADKTIDKETEDLFNHQNKPTKDKH